MRSYLHENNKGINEIDKGFIITYDTVMRTKVNIWRINQAKCNKTKLFNADELHRGYISW